MEWHHIFMHLILLKWFQVEAWQKICILEYETDTDVDIGIMFTLGS